MNPPHILTRATSPPRGVSPTAPFLECDYDVRPTILYKCIQSKSWPRCLQILNHPEHSAQASVWVVRKEPNGKLRWRLLPLHAALIFQAPFHVIEALLEAHPEAAAAKDDQGMLPLHLALRNRPIQWATVEELLTAYPAGVYVQDRKGRTPLQGAASASNAHRMDDGNTVDTDGAHDDASNNSTALSVLQLYTQIAVAGERKRLEQPNDNKQDESHKIQQLEQKHAESLQHLQALLQKEKQLWKRHLEAAKKELHNQTQQANARESVLLKEIERLQQQISHGDNASQPAGRRRVRSSLSSGPASPTVQDLRVLELEQENDTLRETVEQLYNHHQSLQRSMDRLQEEQRQAQEFQSRQWQSLHQSFQQTNASRQAHIAIWKSQLQQAGKTVTEKLAQIGLTSASADTDDDERTYLEQVEIDQDNEESQVSSVVVVRVPKVFFRPAKQESQSTRPVQSSSSAASESTITVHSVPIEPRQTSSGDDRDGGLKEPVREQPVDSNARESTGGAKVSALATESGFATNAFCTGPLYTSR